MKEMNSNEMRRDFQNGLRSEGERLVPDLAALQDLLLVP